MSKYVITSKKIDWEAHYEITVETEVAYERTIPAKYQKSVHLFHGFGRCFYICFLCFFVLADD